MIPAEQMTTNQFMRLYVLGDMAPEGRQRRSLHAKVGYLLRRRGIRAAQMHISWEPHSAVSLSRVKAECISAVEKVVRHPAARQFWATRVQWHEAAARSAARGKQGKPMRNVAQQFIPTQTRGLEAVDAWRVRRKDPIILDLNNIHVPLPKKEQK